MGSGKCFQDEEETGLECRDSNPGFFMLHFITIKIILNIKMSYV